MIIITPPPPGSCFARGSLGAGSGARVAIINLWPCPGIVLPVVIVVLVVVILVVVVVVVLTVVMVVIVALITEHSGKA